MRIALAVTAQYPVDRVLPRGVVYASISVHISLAYELAAMGHEVTVYCSEDSPIQAPLIKRSIGVDSLYKQRLDYPERTYSYKYAYALDMTLFGLMYRDAAEGKFDLIWNNDPTRVAPFCLLSTTQTVFTLHDPLDREHYKFLPKLQEMTGNFGFVSISNAQRKPLPELRYLETIYHGIELNELPFVADPEDYFVFFGRVIKEKGVLDAIKVAHEAGVKLKIIGPLGRETADKSAYADAVLAACDGAVIEYVGELTYAELQPIVSRAKGFINMIDVWESFGLVLVESMAMGVPVIARNMGAVPEVVVDGKTGFVIDTIEEAVAAVKKIDSIDRSACRKHVADSFTIQRAARDYDALFRRLQDHPLS